MIDAFPSPYSFSQAYHKSTVTFLNEMIQQTSDVTKSRNKKITISYLVLVNGAR